MIDRLYPRVHCNLSDPGLLGGFFMFQSDRGDQMETGQRSKSLRSLSTFFSDRSDRSDRSDHMETRLKINKLSRSVLWQQQDLRDKAMKHDTVMQEQRQLTQEQKTKKNRHKTDQIITLSYFRNNRQTELKPAIFPTLLYGCMLIVIVVNLC